VSPRLPRVTAAEVVRVLEKRGFTLSRQSGSHRIYNDEAGNRVTVPFHSTKILHPKVLRSILNDAGMTIEEFMQLL
jgi:predicted RNA binding protein YcfA (HicA-like mRNA interferase family)